MCDNVVIGIESSGPHSNGFSLIRKIIKESKLTEEEKTKIAKRCLQPTLLYPKLIMELISNYKINALSHITGGGLTENLPRSITNDLCVEIDTNLADDINKSVIQEQVELGVAVRMACLKIFCE